MNAYLGLDIGTTHIKVTILSEAGQILAQRATDTPISSDHWGVVHEAQALANAAKTIIKEVVGQVGAVKIQALSVASIGEEGFFLGDNGMPLYPAIAWFEHRVSASQELWREHHPDARFRTGLVVKPSYSIFKWLWMKDSIPGLWDQVRIWVSVSDYIGFLLSGELCISYSQAARTYIFDPVKRSWITPWVNEILPSGVYNLPPIVPSGTVVGYTGTTSREWGLEPGVAVVVGGHDHPVGTIGAGVIDSSKMLDSMGTAELLYWPVDTLAGVSMQGAFEYGYTGYPSGPYYIASGSYTGMMIGTLSRLFDVDLSRLSDANATKMPEPSLLVIPKQLGEKPGFDIRGLTQGTTGDDVVLAALAASAMVIRWAFNHIPGALSVNPALVVIGGGATPLALRLKADILQRPVHAVQGAEIVALGAAQIARKSLTGREDLAVSLHTVEPDPSRECYYHGLFETFVANWQ